MLDAGDIPARVKLDAEGRVAGDLACRQCGYNLRTLSKEAKCPECGTSVEQSWRGEWLLYSDPAWLERIATGLKWLVSATLLWLLSIPVSAAAVAVANALSPGTRGMVFNISSVINRVIALAAVIGCAYGLWEFTKPEPNRLRSASDLDLRRFVRASAGASLATIGIGFFWPAWGAIAFVLRIGIACALLCTAGGVLLYLRELAMRIPDEKEAQATRIILVGLVIGMCFTVPGALGQLSLTSFDCITALGACVDFVVLAAFLFMLNRLRRAFSDIADEERRRQGADNALAAGRST